MSDSEPVSNHRGFVSDLVTILLHSTMRALLRIAKKLQQSSTVAFASTRDASVESTTASTSRLFSKVPGEYEIYYGSSQQPIRSAARPPQQDEGDYVTMQSLARCRFCRRASPAREAVNEATASAAPEASVAASTATAVGNVEGQRQSAAAGEMASRLELKRLQAEPVETSF